MFGFDGDWKRNNRIMNLISLFFLVEITDYQLREEMNNYTSHPFKLKIIFLIMQYNM